MGRKIWRCFHCDEVFRSKKWAREHFGATECDTPACKLTSPEGHLVTYIRELEDQLAQYRSDDSHALRAMYAQRADHAGELRRMEEVGYARGVDAMKAQGYCVEPEKHSPPFKMIDGYYVEQVER